jgi:hypothetical protein
MRSLGVGEVEQNEGEVVEGRLQTAPSQFSRSMAQGRGRRHATQEFNPFIMFQLSFPSTAAFNPNLKLTTRVDFPRNAPVRN